MNGRARRSRRHGDGLPFTIPEFLGAVLLIGCLALCAGAAVLADWRLCIATGTIAAGLLILHAVFGHSRVTGYQPAEGPEAK